MSHPSELDAVLAFVTALAVAAILTPVTMRIARAVGAIDRPRARGLSDRCTPLLGGLAIFAGALVAGLVWLPAGYGGDAHLWQGVLLAAGVIALVGALDDRFELPPAVKLAGQVLAAIIVVHFGVAVKAITLPFIGTLHFPNAGATNAGPVLTVIGLVLMMNVVNFSDGVDGLAAGVCVIIAAAMAVIAFDLSRQQPGVLAALTAGAALGFLLYNFPPAADPARGALPGHHVRDPQAPEVPPADLPPRQRALPPPHGADRLFQPPYDRLPVRVDADARGRRARASLRPLQRPQRPPAHGLDALHGGARTRGGRFERVPGLRAGDPQVPPPGHDAPEPAAPGRLSRRDRARRGQGPRNGGISDRRVRRPGRRRRTIRRPPPAWGSAADQPAAGG